MAETEFDRSMSRIVRGTKSVRTIIFPNSVRKVLGNAFLDARLVSVVLNEGLEILGELNDDNGSCCSGVFQSTLVK